MRNNWSPLAGSAQRRGDWVAAYDFLKRQIRGTSTDIHSLVMSYRTKGDAMKLRWEIQVGFHSRVWCAWDRLLRALGMAPSWQSSRVFGRHSHWFLSGPVWSKELDLMIFRGSFQLRKFYVSMKSVDSKWKLPLFPFLGYFNFTSSWFKDIKA